ncbi:helix-turn-helix domain-containing protein [Emcibacter sp.]|uniref:helix-turn-helix domain-containing protein n=1 Tax=Emcibacter sp. TaxID=1979954 RepID=UPI003A8CB73D
MEMIPNFVLYGEEDREIFPDYLHIESIRARSLGFGWKFHAHRHHNLYQFFFISKGGGTALIESQNHFLLNGHVILMPPMSVHGFDFLPDTEGWVLTVPDPFLQRILEEETVLINYLAKARIFHSEEKTKTNEIREIFAGIEREHAVSQPMRGLGVRSLLTHLAVTLYRTFPPQEDVPQSAASQKQKLLREFQKLVDMHFRERWPVGRYAEILGITPTHLSRICKQVLDVPASDLITERSLLEARRLLIYTSLGISEIGWELGFSNPAHFSKFFREKTRRKPSEFRQAFTRRA